MASSASGTGPGVQSVRVRNFVASRVAEIASLTTQIRNSGTTASGRTRGFSFQHVSTHMRRRAVSHNPKRLPVRLRPRHLNQIMKSSGGVIKKPKRPNRAYRRRTEGDILEYNRRQIGKPVWLESHIWHAKRFHMKSLWGRKLAVAPTAKCFRSLFAAAKNGAIMHDISYLYCLEIIGSKEALLKGMSAIIPEDFLRFDATTEMIGHIYCPVNESYIGAVNYLWIPATNRTASACSKVIIWMHPASKTQILNSLISVFNLGTGVSSAFKQSFPDSPNQDEQKYLWRTMGNLVWQDISQSVCMRELNGCLNRIRLTGPKTLPILKEVLKVGLFKTGNDDLDNVMKAKQTEFWGNLKRIVDLPSNTIISLNVVDPRLELPRKRTHIKEIKRDECYELAVLCDAICDGLLWNESARAEVLRKKTSDAELAKIRSQNLIPGTSIEHNLQPNVIPIIVVLRSGRSSKFVSSSFVGADLIVPMGWFMPFWIALSFRCVRAYGLEFSDYLTFEEDPYLQNLPLSTILSPDSVSYLVENERMEKEIKDDFYSRPPAKRQNMIKLGCAFPFSIDWSKFTRFICKNGDSGNFQVVRKRCELIALSKYLRDGVPLENPISESAFLPVEVTVLSGTSESRACICLPTVEDLKLFVSGKSSDYHIQQEQMKDVNEKHRDELFRQHHKRVSHLRKKRKLARKAAQLESFDLDSRLNALDSREDSEKYNKDMNELWLNKDIEDVLSKQDREVIGLTTYAHYSFRRGKSAAIGYANVKQLMKLVQLRDELSHTVTEKFKAKVNSQLLVLVRNWSSSLTYVWANLNFPDT